MEDHSRERNLRERCPPRVRLRVFAVELQTRPRPAAHRHPCQLAARCRSQLPDTRLLPHCGTQFLLCRLPVIWAQPTSVAAASLANRSTQPAGATIAVGRATSPNTLTSPVNHTAVAPAIKTIQMPTNASATTRVVALHTVVPPVVDWSSPNGSYRTFD